MSVPSWVLSVYFMHLFMRVSNANVCLYKTSELNPPSSYFPTQRKYVLPSRKAKNVSTYWTSSSGTWQNSWTCYYCSTLNSMPLPFKLHVISE